MFNGKLSKRSQSRKYSVKTKTQNLISSIHTLTKALRDVADLIHEQKIDESKELEESMQSLSHTHEINNTSIKQRKNEDTEALDIIKFKLNDIDLKKNASVSLVLQCRQHVEELRFDILATVEKKWKMHLINISAFESLKLQFCIHQKEFEEQTKKLIEIETKRLEDHVDLISNSLEKQTLMQKSLLDSDAKHERHEESRRLDEQKQHEVMLHEMEIRSNLESDLKTVNTQCENEVYKVNATYSTMFKSLELLAEMILNDFINTTSSLEISFVNNICAITNTRESLAKLLPYSKLLLSALENNEFKAGSTTPNSSNNQ